ncbi:hypothetical protein, partial [Citrobacter freundii]
VYQSWKNQRSSACINRHQKAKKWLTSGSRKTLNCLDRSTSFVKDNLSIGRIAAGISPAGIIFSVSARPRLLT